MNQTTKVTTMKQKQHFLLPLRLFGVIAGIVIIPSLVIFVFVFSILKEHVVFWHMLLLFGIIFILLCGILAGLFDYIIFRPMRILAHNMQVLLDKHKLDVQNTVSPNLMPKIGWGVDECIRFFADTQQSVSMLFNVSRMLLSSLDIDEIISGVLHMLNRQGNVHVSCMIRMDTDGYLKVRSQHGFSAETLRIIRYRPSEGLIGRVYSTLQCAIINNTAQEGDGLTALIRERDKIESLLFLPVAIENQTLGVMCIGSRIPGYFTSVRIKTLSSISDYIAVALHNAQLHEQLQTFNRRLEAEVSATTQELTHTNTRLIKKVRELKILYDILMAISTKLDIGEVMSVLMEKISDLVDAELFLFFMRENNTESLVLERMVIGQKTMSGMSFRVGPHDRSILKDAFESGKTFFSNTLLQHHHTQLGVPDSYTVKSLICLPVRAHFDTVGVFCVGNKVSGQFTQDDLRVLQLLINQLGEVLENITLYHDREKRVGDLIMLQRISSTISSSPVLPVTLKNISHIIAETLHIDYCVFHLYEDATGELVPQVGFNKHSGINTKQMRIGIDDQYAIPVHVFKAGKPFVTGRAMEGEQMLKIPEKLLESISGSLLVFPLRVENQIIGVLTLGSKKEGYFIAEHLRLTELIADQSAIIIDNATLYQRIREAVKELEKLNKMKNEFISVVSHELRTPITTIMGFNNILLKEDAGPLTDQQRRFLKISEQSANRLSDLINDLLDISRIESGRIDLQIVSTDIPELLHKIETLFTKECKAKKISLTLNIQDSLPSVCVDQDRMLQVFKHLVQNSVKFTDPHGKITISASDRGDYIQLDFADTGAGITKENHEKIFDKFYQVDTSSARRAGGTGLGLSIVRSIVELHGGKIWIESQLGKGSVFKLIIPKSKLRESAYEEKGINR